MKYKNLNPILHNQLRLTIISTLISNGKSDFKTLKEISEATSGNLSVQIKKLEEQQYLKVTKNFLNNYPNTSVEITKKGVKAFEDYVAALKGYIDKNE